MDYLIYILGLAFAFVSGLFFRNYLPSYFNEKGKNLATKEDIKEITQTVEGVKSDISKDLEFLKWELGKRAAIHRLVAEKEIAAVSEIGAALFDLRIATVSLRPMADYLPSDEAAKKQKFQERFNTWAEKHNLFLNIVEKHRLFLPDSFYKVFSAIRELSAKEAISFDSKLKYSRHGFTFDDYEESAKNTEQLIKAIDITAEIIHRKYEIEGLNIPSVPSIKNSHNTNSEA